jgi:hypothetical protein
MNKIIKRRSSDEHNPMSVQSFTDDCPLSMKESRDNIWLDLQKALIRSVVTYACPHWECTAVTHLLELQRLKIKFLRRPSNLLVSKMNLNKHVAFKTA